MVQRKRGALRIDEEERREDIIINSRAGRMKSWITARRARTHMQTQSLPFILLLMMFSSRLTGSGEENGTARELCSATGPTGETCTGKGHLRRNSTSTTKDDSFTLEKAPCPHLADLIFCFGASRPLRSSGAGFAKHP